MSNVDRSAIVAHSADRMFALVEDIESYPRFLPWCERAVVLSREPGRTVATLHVNVHGLRQHFTTENANQPGVSIRMKLVEGPFRDLDGRWSFADLGPGGCKIEFRLHYEFGSALLEKALGPAFHRITDRFVEAFVRRAEEKFGRT
jgi:ribosome-associated toxin RatA of RatAB toxin-antitoxin module